MLFWIVLALVVIIPLSVAIFGSYRHTSEMVGDLVGTLVVCSMFGFVLLGISSAATSVSANTHTEIIGVKTYELADGATVVGTTYDVEFIYREDGEPKKFSESAKTLVVEGDSGIVEVTDTAYEHGTQIWPWGLGGTFKTVTVK